MEDIGLKKRMVSDGVAHIVYFLGQEVIGTEQYLCLVVQLFKIKNNVEQKNFNN